MKLGRIKIYRFIVFVIKNFTLSLLWRKKIFYYDSVSNFGDKMNMMICNNISNERFAYITSTEFLNLSNYLIIGSVLQVANKNSIVWGSGFHFQSSKFIYSPPSKILAVRGPLTRKKLIDNKIYCPPVYGDPALLLPGFYKPLVKKKYKVGIIPHYSNQNNPWLANLIDNQEILIIDVKSSPEQVVKEILMCEVIISSSLHGIIISDAYKIPNVWVVFSKNLGLDNFKFYDYFESVSREPIEPINVDGKDLDQVLRYTYKGSFNYDPSPLLNASPFKLNEKFKRDIILWYKTIN